MSRIEKTVHAKGRLGILIVGLFAVFLPTQAPICVTRAIPSHDPGGTHIAQSRIVGTEGAMSLVRLIGFTTLGCGCVVGRYREVATSREVTYVEEKGKTCGSHGHRRNHTIAVERSGAGSSIALATKAS